MRPQTDLGDEKNPLPVQSNVTVRATADLQKQIQGELLVDQGKSIAELLEQQKEGGKE